MNNKKTIGIILILVGIGLFIISFAFVKGYDNRDGFLGSLGQMKFVLREGESLKPEAPRPAEAPLTAPPVEPPRIVEDFKPVEEDAIKRPIAVPYKYFFAIDIAIIFVGIGFLMLPKRSSIN
jgi:hypothetical protein